MTKVATPRELELERAQFAVDEAKKRFENTKGALQYRLKPSTLANNAWDGVREKGGAAADGAVGAAREHSGALGGVVAALTLFLARGQIWRILSAIFGHGREKPDPNVVSARLDKADPKFDLTAPTVERSKQEGVIA